MVIGDSHRPTVPWGDSGNGDVAAESHKHTTFDALIDEVRGAVGGVRLGSRAEVELETGGDADRSRGAVQAH